MNARFVWRACACTVSRLFVFHPISSASSGGLSQADPFYHLKLKKQKILINKSNLTEIENSLLS